METPDIIVICRRCGGKKLKREMGLGGICDKCWDDTMYPELAGKEFKDNE